LLFVLLLMSWQSTRENEKQRGNECESGHGDSCRLDSVCYHKSCLRHSAS
jgi:hypothetical protein